MPPTKKTYTDLMELRATDYMSPKAQIGTCEKILPNRLRCHRAGDYHIVEEIPVEDKGKPGIRTVEYQFCRAHAKLQQQEDAELLAKEAQASEASSKTVQIGSMAEFAALDKTAATLQPGDTVKIPVSILHQAMGITPTSKTLEAHDSVPQPVITAPHEETGTVVTGKEGEAA